MPISIKKYGYQQGDAPNNNTNGGLPGDDILALPLLFKNPKLLLIEPVIFGGWYFFNGVCDDNKYGGAFQIYNSWAAEWGINGLAWERDQEFEEFCVEPHRIITLPPKEAAAEQNFIQARESLVTILPKMERTARFGKNIPLNGVSETQIMGKNQELKIEINNTNPYYVYILCKETDNSTYTLFPYAEKYSAYCGITGSRIFPDNFNTYQDKIGNKDFMAVLKSKNPSDYKQLSAGIRGNGSSFAVGIKNALGIRYKSTGKLNSGQVFFNNETRGNADVAFSLLAINK